MDLNLWGDLWIVGDGHEEQSARLSCQIGHRQSSALYVILRQFSTYY